ncbi:CsbD family protein [Mycobacterium sp.]|uniref:microaggregate-binding protein 1 n=1 Tax=Mycobacterium sp. TaxID=1785 RepID=UPI002C0E71B3|nr:CsbD family protein [Mycobacterium sp.]HTQ16972.1 CsbD family protein [Mycobacterium sp.]
MSDRDSGPVAAIKGVIEDAIGKAKEIIGIVISHEGLRKEGRAQQEKAEAQRNVAKKEAQAEAARAAASAAEARQKASQ